MTPMEAFVKCKTNLANEKKSYSTELASKEPFTTVKAYKALSSPP